MALIIEDGSLVSGANSYITLADARTTSADYGITLPDDDTQAEITLRQAYLSLITQERKLQGSRISGVQTGIYPRSGVLNNCIAIASDEIPNEVVMAQLYAAEGITAGAAVNNVTTGERISEFNVQGVYSEKYQDGSRASVNPTIQGVYNSLYPLTKAGLASSPCGNGGGLYKESMGFL